jgi:hypothetical protein
MNELQNMIKGMFTMPPVVYVPEIMESCSQCGSDEFHIYYDPKAQSKYPVCADCGTAYIL